MGINNLNVLLRKHCPEVYEEIHISEYAYKKVAIDISLFLCKYKAICGDNWVKAFINLVSSLRRNEIHCVFIYDSGSPPEKADEKAERVKQREKNEQRVYDLEISLEHYYNTGEIDSVLLEFYEKIKKDAKIPTKRLLSKKKVDDTIDIDLIKTKIDKMRSNILNISKEDFELTRELFTILNIPFYDAPMEAETCCSDLCKRGIVDAVLSEDTDVLAYSTPTFLTKIDTIHDTCVRIKHAEILESLEIDDKQFLDLCIMCGCDYNKNIPKVGVETSFKYIKKYGSIDDIKENLNIDVSILNHNRTRELFTGYEKINLSSVPFCGSPDLVKLEEFINKHNIDIKIETLKKNLTHVVLVIEEENEEENEEEIEYEISEEDE
jgi:flap endonuclease-1